MAVEAIQQAQAEGTVVPGGGILIKVPNVVRMSALAEAHKAVQVMMTDTLLIMIRKEGLSSNERFPDDHIISVTARECTHMHYK